MHRRELTWAYSLLSFVFYYSFTHSASSKLQSHSALVDNGLLSTCQTHSDSTGKGFRFSNVTSRKMFKNKLTSLSTRTKRNKKLIIKFRRGILPREESVALYWQEYDTARHIRAYIPFCSHFHPRTLSFSLLQVDPRILHVFRRSVTRTIVNSRGKTTPPSTDAFPGVGTRVLTASSWSRRRASRESSVGTLVVTGRAPLAWRRPAGLYDIAFLLSHWFS